MVRKIVAQVPPQTLEKDLERYRQMAIELGATDAKIVPSSQVIIDERVRLKCTYPKCKWYGTNANCPPYAVDLETMKKALFKYNSAIFFMLETPSKDFVGPDVVKLGTHVQWTRKVYEITSKIEAAAFYDGYHLAMGFAGGPCKSIFCPNENCSALTGTGCRHYLKSRSAMEGVGMDVFTMAARTGWEVYPCGASLKPEDVPHGIRCGLILIH